MGPLSVGTVGGRSHNRFFQNKPNGQFHLEFDAEVIREFMRELPIRKIPGIGRVTERLLDSIGIKVSSDSYTSCPFKHA